MMGTHRERIDDAQAFVKRHFVLHVLRPQDVAAGVKRRGGDHGVIGGEAVSLGELQPGFMSLKRERMNRQQGARLAISEATNVQVARSSWLMWLSHRNWSRSMAWNLSRLCR